MKERGENYVCQPEPFRIAASSMSPHLICDFPSFDSQNI
jgi:hypothetical protein